MKLCDIVETKAFPRPTNQNRPKRIKPVFRSGGPEGPGPSPDDAFWYTIDRNGLVTHGSMSEGEPSEEFMDNVEWSLNEIKQGLQTGKCKDISGRSWKVNLDPQYHGETWPGESFTLQTSTQIREFLLRDFQ